MVMRSAPQTSSKSGALKGALFLLGLTLLSVLSVNISGRAVNFLFFPVMAIFLWPRVENPVASIRATWSLAAYLPDHIHAFSSA